MKDIKKIQEFFSKPLGEGTLTQDELAYYRDNAMEKLANADIVDKKLGKTRQGDKYIMVMYKEKWDFANPPKKGMYNPETQWVKVFYNDESEIQDLMALKETKVVNEGKQLDQVDFAKVVKAVEQTGHPVTVLLVPKFNEIEVITGMDAPDDMLRDLSNAVDALGYSRNDIFIAGDSSNLSRREYSDISRVNGGAKDYFEESVNEMDMNDPVLIKMRAAKDKLAKMRAANAGDDGNDKFFDNAKKIAFLKKERAQLMRDMEQEAEPEGGPIADEYGSKLNRIDAAIAKLSGRKEMDYDTAVGKVNEYDVYMPSQEEVDRFFELTNNETHYLYSKPVMGQEGTFNLMPIEPWDEYDYSNWKALVGKAKAKGKSIDEASRARVSKPRFKKDKNAPNFLNVYIDYDLGPGGATIALGKETMTGQIRRESAAEAMQLAGAVARDLEAKYDLEDIDIQDLKNGKVRIFAVSDDFIDMDPNMLSEASKGAMNYFSDLKYNYQKAFRYLDVEEREEYKQLVKDFFSNLQIDDKVRAVNLEEAVNPEVHRLVNAFVRKMADRYDYPLQDAVYAILEVLRSQNYLGLDEATEDEENEFHKELDKLVHKTFGHSSDEKKKSMAQELAETIKLGEGVIEEELCPKGKAYIKRRQAAGEKSSAYLSGRAVKVCKGQMSGRKKKKKK